MKSIIFTLSILFFFSAFAEVDNHSLMKTQDLLRDANKRNAHIKASSPQAQQAMQMLRGMGMSEQQEKALMEIAADSFGSQLKNTNGDTAKLKDQLTKGMTDPESFLKNMSGDSRNRIRDLSNQVENMNKNERK
jgi:hypothetical protein